MQLTLDERIEAARTVLLVRLIPTTVASVNASVYVLATSGAYDWVPISGEISLEGAADLVADLRDRRGEVRFEVVMSEAVRGEDRDTLLRNLSREVYARGVRIKPVVEVP